MTAMRVGTGGTPERDTHEPPPKWDETSIGISKVTRRRFTAAKKRSQTRQDRDELYNDEFLRLLLDVWEEYEEPRRDGRR